MQQNSCEIEIPRSKTLVMGSYPSVNIAQLLHEEIVLQFGIGGCAPEGSMPLVDLDVMMAEDTTEDILVLAKYLAEAA